MVTIRSEKIGGLVSEQLSRLLNFSFIYVSMLSAFIFDYKPIALKLVDAQKIELN